MKTPEQIEEAMIRLQEVIDEGKKNGFNTMLVEGQLNTLIWVMDGYVPKKEAIK